MTAIKSRRATIDDPSFVTAAESSMPFDLRLRHIKAAMEDVYDFFGDVNDLLIGKGLPRFDDMLRPAAMSGIISDMLTASIARQSRTLVENQHFNGHPDLLVRGRYPGNAIQSGSDGIEIKSTVKAGGAVDTHGGRNQWMCVFVYEARFDGTKPAHEQEPMRFVEVYLAQVMTTDFRRNDRSVGGTRTATLDRNGLLKLRQGRLYFVAGNRTPRTTKKVKT